MFEFHEKLFTQPVSLLCHPLCKSNKFSLEVKRAFNSNACGNNKGTCLNLNYHVDAIKQCDIWQLSKRQASHRQHCEQFERIKKKQQQQQKMVQIDIDEPVCHGEIPCAILS